MSEHKFPYNWTLKDAKFTKDKGTVFSTFACGGGSTMGYKLAGFDVIGCNDIDPKMMKAYIKNHDPKYHYTQPIQDFKNCDNLPNELYELDILDGSPPCSSFSMAGSREKAWGEEKKFREGQAEQVLDTLFFDHIDLVKRLQPKVAICENVSGMMMGEAKGYVRRVFDAFTAAGYSLRVEPYLLDASTMGVPQRRKRVFFIALRNDLAEPFMEQIDMFQRAPKLELNFNEPGIPYGQYRDEVGSDKGITDYILERMAKRIPSDTSIGDINAREYDMTSMFNQQILRDDQIVPTITAGATMYRDFDVKTPTAKDIMNAGSYPQDYDFCGNPVQYLVGMSVPPVMVAQIATQVWDQWLSKIGPQVDPREVVHNDLKNEYLSHVAESEFNVISYEKWLVEKYIDLKLKT